MEGERDFVFSRSNYGCLRVGLLFFILFIGGDMPLLNFKNQFVEKIKIGLSDPLNPEGKRQTIRARRKDGRNPKQGQKLYLFTGLRTEHTKKIGEVFCVSSETVTIDENIDIWIGVRCISNSEAAELATKDGFESFNEFIEFFKKTHSLPFYGFLIKW